MHFFTEVSNLPSQSSLEKFGPIDSDQTNQYNVTSGFQMLVSAKAFSCQKGSIVVLQSATDPSLVNVILKPSETLSIPFQTVNYYIYRGLLKNSFFNDSLVIIDDPATNTELRTRIANANTLEEAYSANVIGFDNNLLSASNHIETIFNNSSGFGIRPININEGEWFANFNIGEIGFEIILESDKINVSLDFVRSSKTIINTNSLSGFDLRAKREEILAYIDPAAFTGLHYIQGIGVSSYNGTDKSTMTIKGADLNVILNKFFTKNRVYLDIRSEKGYSYNFYQNYSDGSSNNNNIKLPNLQPYATQSWPIIYFDQTQQSNININLRIDDNSSPILFIQNNLGKKTDPKSNFVVIKNDNTGWSNTITFLTPNSVVFAYYFKSYYFRNRYNPNSPQSILVNKKYYDSAFCPISLINLSLTPGVHNLKVINPNVHFVREPLQLNGTGNFAYAAHNGAHWDSNRVLFYSVLINQQSSSEKKFLPTFSQDFLLGTEKIDSNLDVICRNYQNVNESPAENIKILGVNNYSISSKNQGLISDKEIILLLGLTIEEMSAIQGVTGLSNNHHQYIYLQQTEGNPLKDQGGALGKRFYQYNILVQGLDNNGNQIFVTPSIVNSSSTSGLPIRVYTRDQLFFHSTSFSALENLSSGDNEIEFNIYSDGTINISDNIDFGLVYDVQRIYYKYINKNNNDTVTNICNLQIQKANKMARVKNDANGTITNPNLTETYTKPTKTFTTGDARQFYEDTLTGNIVTYGRYKGGNAWQLFLNQGKVIFMVFLDPNLINNVGLNINFAFSATNRRYANPSLAASFMGALVDFGEKLTSTGLAFFDGTCFPSTEHANGEALDTVYINLIPATADDVKFAVALNKFGFSLFRVGAHKTALKTAILNSPGFTGTVDSDKNQPTPSLHDSHFHSTNVILKKQ